MKILHAVLSSGFYGSERYCIDLAIDQARRGHTVTVLGADPRSPAAQQLRAEIAAASATDKPAAIPRLTEIPRHVPAWLHRPIAAAILLRERPDIVHTHLNPAARRVGGVAQRLRIPHVMTLHLDYDRREHASIDGLIALTTKQEEAISAEFVGETAVIWNWLPSRVAAGLKRVSPADVQRLRASHGADDTTVVFGTVGRLMPEKGIDTLIQAFKMAFPPSNAGVRLLIVGAGDELSKLQDLAANDRRIVLTGAQADIAPFYRAFDVFISAARFEPFSLAIIEAMASGCRLIATRIHGTVEFVTDPRVLWTDPDDAAGLAQKLSTAAQEQRERYVYDMSRLTLARASSEIEEFYRYVAARR